MTRFCVLMAALLMTCVAQAGEIFYRPAGATSVVLDHICVPDVNGIVVDPALDFNTSGLVVTIHASGSATPFVYTTTNLTDGPNSVTWGAPVASAIEIDKLADGCLRLHIRDEVFAVAGSTDWAIKFTDGGTLIMDHVVQVLAGSTLDAAGVRSAVGLASANLDTQLTTIDTNVDAILVDTGTTLQAELDGIQADTENIQTRLPAALIGGRMDSDVEAINNDTGAADNLAVTFDNPVFIP